MTSPRKQLGQIEDMKAKACMQELAQYIGPITPAPHGESKSPPPRKKTQDEEEKKIGWVLVYDPANKEKRMSCMDMPTLTTGPQP